MRSLFLRSVELLKSSSALPLWMGGVMGSCLWLQHLLPVAGPRYFLGGLLGLFLLGGALLVRGFSSAKKRRADYRSGRVERVERAVLEEQRDAGAPRRLRALAMAGVGQFAAARRAMLGRIELDGEDPEESAELSLCAEVVMEAFEGKQGRALRLCHALVALPLQKGVAQRARREARRAGSVAIARAVAGAADEYDYEALGRAATFEPSMYWACRYGAAVACFFKQEPELALSLVKDAPAWPEHSAFFRIHARLSPEPERLLHVA